MDNYLSQKQLSRSTKTKILGDLVRAIAREQARKDHDYEKSRHLR